MRVRIGKKKILFETEIEEQNFFEKNDGKTATITIEKKRRSLPQNRYLWVIYTLIAEHTGHTAEEIHEVEKQRHIIPKFIKIKTKEYEIRPSTTQLSKESMALYIEKVIVDASQLGIIIPTMEEAGYIGNT